MPDTVGHALTYPASTAHARLWEHLQALAEDVERELTVVDSAWVPFTPVWSQSGGATLAIGNGTLTGRYKVVGKTVHATVEMVRGSTTNAGTAAYVWSLPAGVPLPRTFRVSGSGAIYTATAQFGLSVVGITTGSFVAQRTTNDVRIGNTGYGAAWAVGDALCFDLTYETP